MSRRILVVDDEREMAELVVDYMAARGFAALSTTKPEEAVALVEVHDVEVVIADLNMPKLDGIELCRDLHVRFPATPVLIMTAFGSIAGAVDAMRAGAHDFLTKPLDLGALQIAVERALEHRDLLVEVEQLRLAVGQRTRFHGFVGDSPAMRELYETLSRVGEIDSSIVLQGETGTGKELAARAIHAESSRRDGPFVSVNLSAVPEALLESQFFGHEKGAFTDARTKSEGLLVAANGGTLFLDEVGDMPAVLQPKLLRALQERSVRPVGATAEVKFDARILSATHQDLEKAVERGTFREDLYYRLNVISIRLPPLREREQDVLELAMYFALKFAARMNRARPTMTPAALAALSAYRWPGNVRELANAMERAVALCRGDEIGVDDLPETVRRTPRPNPAPGNKAFAPTSLEEVERRHILDVLAHVDGNKLKAAKILGLDRRTLYRRLEKYES